ncbi:MAG: hypothetical protein JRN20_04735 [Nitrososphaerota archaeon]|nr:hypothetical protein [Nitrososphaerota archaeon]
MLKDRITSSHVFIFSRSAFRSMQNTLYDKFGTGASVIMYEMGQGYGRKLGAGMLKRGLNQEKAFSEIEKFGYLAGWTDSHFRVLSEVEIECVARNSIFTIERPETKRRSCYFLAGALSGNVSAMLNEEFRAEETQCVVGGHEMCKFRIFREESS